MHFKETSCAKNNGSVGGRHEEEAAPNSRADMWQRICYSERGRRSTGCGTQGVILLCQVDFLAKLRLGVHAGVHGGEGAARYSPFKRMGGDALSDFYAGTQVALEDTNGEIRGKIRGQRVEAAGRNDYGMRFGSQEVKPKEVMSSAACGEIKIFSHSDIRSLTQKFSPGVIEYR